MLNNTSSVAYITAERYSAIFITGKALFIPYSTCKGCHISDMRCHLRAIMTPGFQLDASQDRASCPELLARTHGPADITMITCLSCAC